MDITKLSRKEKELLFKAKARQLLDFEDWAEIDDEFNNNWNPRNWTDEELDKRTKDAISQIRFNKTWPVITFIIVLLLVYFISKFIL